MFDFNKRWAIIKHCWKTRLHEFHWQWFRDFFGVEILKYFVVWFTIVPIVLYVTRDVPEFIPLAVGHGAPMMLHFGLPFGWLELWLASVAYTAALVLYKFYCPRVVARYHNFGEYLRECNSPRWISWMVHHAITTGGLETKLVHRMLEKKYLSPSAEFLEPNVQSGVKIYPEFSRLIVRQDPGCLEFSMPIIKGGRIDDDATRVMELDVFWEIFGYYASTRPFIRMLITILLLIALALFSYVLFEHIWSVIPYVREKLLV